MHADNIIFENPSLKVLRKSLPKENINTEPVIYFAATPMFSNPSNLSLISSVKLGLGGFSVESILAICIDTLQEENNQSPSEEIVKALCRLSEAEELIRYKNTKNSG